MKLLTNPVRSFRRKTIKWVVFLLLPLAYISCKKSFLDVVPDNVATLDDAFTNSVQAEKFLFTCYSYLPQEGHPDLNPAFSGGDELWTYWPMTQDYIYLDPYNIAHGLQTQTNPQLNYWDNCANKNLWQGIRNCNIFLENVAKVSDLQPYLKTRWTAEVKFIKAYLHWYLLRMYGPIPIVDVNLPITASLPQVQVSRQPVDSVVNYIANLLDQAAGDGNNALPNIISNKSDELGRVTRVAALAIKARVLVTAASPLFNGNSDFSGYKGKNGALLFNPQYDAAKWTRAAVACKVAIDAATGAGSKLYHFTPTIGTVDSARIVEMSVRNAVCEKWNTELIWGSTSGWVAGGTPVTDWLQLYACPQIDPANTNENLKGKLAPTFKMAEMFYSKNGVPIAEDKTYDYAGRYSLQSTRLQDSDFMQQGYQTVGLHLDREPRFYADMAFDGSTWFMNNGNFNIKSKQGEYTGKKQTRLYSITGYFTKKLVNWNLVATTTSETLDSYPWPVMRLADLYLLYAEALNETGNWSGALPYLNQIRERAGLNSVESSWSNFSTQPNKYTTVAGMRAIIQQERGIEMAFEGSRFWDLRRWKTAPQAMNAGIYGWDVSQTTFEDYNRRVLLFNQQFLAPRDYFWPLAESDIQIDPNLTQSPGW